MVKNLIKSVTFFVLLIFILLGAGLILRPKNNTKEAGMNNVSANGILAERDDSLDVLVLGDSESYNSFIPLDMWEEYGFTSYICGTGGQRLYDTLNYAKRTFGNQSPQLVILEADTFFRKCKVSDCVLFDMQTKFPVLKYHDRWKSLEIKDFTALPEYTAVNIYKGYLLQTMHKAPKIKTDYMKENKNNASEIYFTNQYYFEQLVKLCEENNAELILVSAPSHKNWSYARHDKVQALADKYSLEYLDFNYYCDELGIDWSMDTKDKGDHLNYFGAVKVTAYLGEWLHNNYELPDHRQDPAYSDWNECLERFREAVKKKLGNQQ